MADRTATGRVATAIAANAGTLLVQLDVTVVTVALPRFGRAFDVGVAALQWIVDGYALVFSVALLTGGFLGDRFGARRVFTLGVALFAAASAGCAAAADLPLLIGARIAQGVGAALMLPCSLSLLNHATEHAPALRARAIGWWTASGSIGLASGPVVGGLLLGAGSWRLLFLINLPVCLVALLAARRAPETPFEEEGQGLDPLGQVLAALALGGLVGGAIEARSLGVAHPAVLVPFAVALGATPLFIRHEARVAGPLLPLDLFRSPVFSMAMVYGAVASMTYYGALFVLSLYVQHVWGFGPAATGLAFLPFTATFTLANLLSVPLTARFGARGCMAVGFVVDAIGFALLLLLGPARPYVVALPAFVLIPLGMGTGIPAMIGAMLGSVARERSGIASAVTNAIRQAGGALGVAAFGGAAAVDIAGGLREAALASAVLLLVTAAASVGLVPRRRVAAEAAV